MNPALRDLLLYAPTWVLPGASVDLDFQNSRYYQTGSGGGPSNLITTSRASTAYADDTSGNWSSFASNLPRITNKGLLVEESRTNGIRNNSMQGAVVGTIGSGGAAPTNWSINNATGGLVIAVSSVTSLNGIDLITFNLSGTTGGGGPFCQIDFEGATTIAALQNQVWTTSQWTQYSNNTNVTGGFLVVQTNNAGGGLLAQDVALNNTTTTFTRLSGSVTLANASAAWVKPFLKITFAATSAVNVNVTIGWPQLELGAFATSPIRTTNAAVTRAADVITLTKVPTFGITASTYMAGTSAPASATQGALTVSDASNNNRIALYRSAGAVASELVVAGGSVIFNSGASTWTASTAGKIAATFIDGGQAVSFSAAAPTTGSAATVPTGLNTVNIGAFNGGSSFWNGYLSRIALFPGSHLSNADLQRITT